MATASVRETLDGGATIYWNVTLDDATKYVVAGANSAAAITAATAVQTANALPVTNEATLKSRTNAALTTNATYLAIAAPTVAQNTAQVQALTKQVDALIRLTQGKLDSVAGT